MIFIQSSLPLNLLQMPNAAVFEINPLSSASFSSGMSLRSIDKRFCKSLTDKLSSFAISS